MDMNEMKPNYAALARKHGLDWRTVKKYHEGYEGKPLHHNKSSCLDKHKEVIKDKVNLPGSTIKGTYKFIKEQDDTIGSYSNFKKYVRKRSLKNANPKNSIHPRYETDYDTKCNLIGKKIFS